MNLKTFSFLLSISALAGGCSEPERSSKPPTAQADAGPADLDAPTPPSNQPRVIASLDLVAGEVDVPGFVTTGVPFADGELLPSHLDRLRVLDRNGSEVAAQYEIRGTYPDSGSVRWLGIDAIVDGSDQHYQLELAASAQRRGQSALRRTTHDGAITIETGKQTFELAGASRQFISNWFVASDGRRFDGVDDEIALETWGPVHGVLRIDGHYESAGEARGLYSMRLHFFANLAELRIDHTFTWTGSHLDLQIDELAVGVLAGGDVTRAHIDTGDALGSGWRTINLDGKSAALYQQSVRHWGHGADSFEIAHGDEVVAEGGRAGHWVAGETASRTTLVGIKDLWQQFPKELRVESDQVVASLYSSRGSAGQLDLRITALEQFWGERMQSRIAQDATLSLLRQQFIDDPTRIDPTGLSKTHQLVILTPTAMDASIEARADAISSGPLWMPSPRHTFDSGVFGALAPRDPASYPELEANTDALWNDVFTAADDWGDYGFFNFGEGPHQLYDGFADGMAQASDWRYTMTLEFGYSLGAFMSFLRSGDRRIYELAVNASRFHADITMPSLDGPRRVRGDYTWSPGFPLIPWQGSGHAQVGASTFGFTIERNLIHYYLTGDRRSLAAFTDYAARRKALIEAAGGPGPWVDEMVEGSFKNESRGSFQRLDDTSLMYLQLGDPLFREAAVAIADAFIKPENVGGIRFEPPTAGGVADSYPAYFFYKFRNMLSFRRIATDAALERVDAALVKMAEWAFVTATEHYSVQESRGFGRLMATAYELTGEVKYLALGLDIVRKRHNRSVAAAPEIPLGATRFYQSEAFLAPASFVSRTSPEGAVRLGSVINGDNMALNGPYLIGGVERAADPSLYEVYLTGQSEFLPLFHNPFGFDLVRPADEIVVFTKGAGETLEVDLATSRVDIRKPDGTTIAAAALTFAGAYTVNLTSFANDDPDKELLRSRPLIRWRVVIGPNDPAGDYSIAVSSDHQLTIFAASHPFEVHATE